MGRLIEVDDPLKCPSRLAVHTGDMLLFRAAGGRVRSGQGIVEMLGPFLQAILVEGGEVLTPQGPPNTVLFRACRPGHAVVDVITGDPFYQPHTTSCELTVES